MAMDKAVVGFGVPMDLPLSLRPVRRQQLALGIPRWYRAVMALILAALAGGIALGGARPGFLAWTLLVLVTLGGLYEERWCFDAGARQVAHRAGLVLAPRTTRIAFEAIETFRVAAGERSADLLLQCADGTLYLIDRRPARRRRELEDLGGRLAAFCARPLVSD